jgi:DNA-binding PadR family transcriptional regulator
MTHTELAILSLLVEKARHGYEIELVFVERGLREWADIGFSSIYYILRKLEKEGLVAARFEEGEGRGPARKVYQVTPAGLDAWHEATLGVLSRPRRQPSPLQLGLANLFALPYEEAISALHAYQEAQQAERERVAARREGQRPLHPYVAAMFDHALALLDAELGWLGDFIRQLEAMHDER